MSTSYLPNAFREERGRFHIFLKTAYPFYLEVENVNRVEGESYCYLRVYCAGAVHPLHYTVLKAVPRNSLIFQMRKLRPIGVNTLSQDHVGSNWQRLGVELISIWF